MPLFELISPSLLAPAVNLLLQTIVNIYLSESHCLTIVSDNPIDFNLDLMFAYVIPNRTAEELKDQLLIVSEQGCSDYLVNMRDQKMFMTAYGMVSKAGSVRRSDRKILFLPAPEILVSKNKLIDLFAMKETHYVANVLVILPSEDNETNCQIFDFVTHKFTGPDEGVDKPMLLNQWNSCTNKFKTNNTLFPHDMTNLLGKVAIMSSFFYSPYGIFDLDPALSPKGRDGMEIRLCEEFCRWINCTLEIFRDDEHEWGEVFENGTGNGVTGNVLEDKADMGAAGLFSWFKEFQYLDFSTPSSRSSVTCVAPSPKLLPSWAIPLMPFSWNMWCAVIITFFFTSLALVIAKGCASDGVFLTVFGVLISQGQKDAETNWRVRSVTGWLLVAGLILVSAYGGGLAATYTSPRYEPSIDTMQDLVDRNMEWGGTHDAWVFSLTSSDDPMIMQVVKLFRLDNDENLEKLTYENKMAFGIEKLPGGHAAVKDYLTEEALADMTEMIEDFYYADVIVVLRKNSYYTDKLTVFVGRLKQSGLMLAWETQVALKYLNLKVQQEIKYSRQRKNAGSAKPLDVTNVLGIFILYAIGVIISTLIFVVERITNGAKAYNLRRRQLPVPRFIRAFALRAGDTEFETRSGQVFEQ